MAEDTFFEILDDIGLTVNQAQVYFVLLKAGKKGGIVRDLDHNLEIKRTNIYPILGELIEMGCVKEGGRAEKSKNATIYVAVDPLEFIDHLIDIKKNEIKELNDIKNRSKPLQKIYIEGVQITLNEVNLSLKPYFEPLINVGWKIASYNERKESTIIEYEVFDCILNSPNAILLKDCSFHVFKFDYDISADNSALDFFSKGLKRKTKEMRSYFFDIKQFQLVDDKITLFGNKYDCFRMFLKTKDLENSDYFPELSEEMLREKNFEAGKAVIIPIKERIFYLWAENDHILEEMVRPIFKVHQINFI